MEHVAEERYISRLTDFGFKRIFDKLFAEAEIAKFTKKELREYEDSLKAYRDIKNSLETAEEKGRTEGMAKGRAKEKKENAKRFLAMGLTPPQVADGTGLPIEVVRQLYLQTSRSSSKLLQSSMYN